MKYNYYKLLLEDGWKINNLHKDSKLTLIKIFYTLADILNKTIPVNTKIKPYEEESDKDNIKIYNDNLYIEINMGQRTTFDDTYFFLKGIQCIYKDDKEALHSIKYSFQRSEIVYEEATYEKSSIDFLNLKESNIKDIFDKLESSEILFPDDMLEVKTCENNCYINNKPYLKENNYFRLDYIYTFKGSHEFEILMQGIEQYKREQAQNKVLKKEL